MKLSSTHKDARPLNRLGLITLLASGLLLAACQPSTPKPGDEGYTTEQVLIQRAEDLLQQARRQSSPLRESLQLEAADLLFRQQQLQRAQSVLEGIQIQQLTLEPLARYSLLGTEIALADDNFFTARGLLTHPALELHYRQLPLQIQQRWHQYRADIFSLLGEEERSLGEYIALSATLADPQQISDAHEQLWQVLSRMPHGTLEHLIDTERDRVRRGWYTLAGLSRNSPGDIHQLQQDIKGWQKDWAWHPGAIYPPAGLDAIDRIATNLPKQLALLLPLSDRTYGKPGKTLLDGFMASYYDVISHGGTPPAIRVYDTAAGEDIAMVYQQAVTEGAELVIGPLHPERVTELSQLTAMPVPTVTLNYLPNNAEQSVDNLYQFGISIAAEAEQVAQRAWLEGRRRALVVTPSSNLGKRVLAAFKEAWESRGGTLVFAADYQSGQNDFKPVIRPALLINQSRQRTKQLSKLLGNKTLVNDPVRRRQDLDMVFVHANPEDARQIKPMLDFYFAGDLPVYSTSLIYSGNVDKGRDSDLNNIQFCAMPWTLPGTISDTIKPDAKLHQSLQLLFALGLDAYRIHQGVLQMQSMPNTRLPGVTGTLQLEPNSQRITREQPWAEFRGGRVRQARLPNNES